ncbi:aldo/keto reductase [Kitasatospora sp. NPDC003701]
MPSVGFGTSQVSDRSAAAVVGTALEAGYRSVDTAGVYGNESGVGRGLAASGVPRRELFVTTKVWTDSQGYDPALRALDASLTRLGLDHVDLYLIHWPAPALDRYVDTWRAFERILADGLARAVGVSNFQPAHLRRLFEATGTVPAVNQVELHPRLQQHALRAVHAAHGIVTEAWSPLGRGQGLLREPAFASIGAKYGVSPAQVVLRWQVQQGHVVIPKSASRERMRENLDLFSFALDADDLATVAALDAGGRIGPDPDTFNVA